MDKIEKFSDIANTTSLGHGLAPRLQLLCFVPQCFLLLSLRQHFPIPQPLKQLLEAVFRDFAGQTMLASCCGTTAGMKIFVVLSEVIPSHLLSVIGVVFEKVVEKWTEFQVLCDMINWRGIFMKECLNTVQIKKNWIKIQPQYLQASPPAHICRYAETKFTSWVSCSWDESAECWVGWGE